MKTQAAKDHPFARAGYIAPYTLRGFSGSLDGAGPDFDVSDSIWFQPNIGGECDVCGACIVDCTHFADATGRKFKVGCDCAEKADMSEDEITAMRKAQKRAARDRRTARAAANPERIAALGAFRALQLDASELYKSLDMEALAAYAHEDEDCAYAGKSAADEIRRLYARDGLARPQNTIDWINGIVTECENGEREDSVEQPDYSKSSLLEHDGAHRVRLFSFGQGNSPSKLVTDSGEILIAWTHPDLSTSEFTSVKLRVKSHNAHDKYNSGAATTTVNYIKIVS